MLRSRMPVIRLIKRQIEFYKEGEMKNGRIIGDLEEINPDVDYSTCTTLIDDHLLDSFAILSLVSEIGDTFDVQIAPGDMIAKEL